MSNFKITKEYKEKSDKILEGMMWELKKRRRCLNIVGWLTRRDDIHIARNEKAVPRVSHDMTRWGLDWKSLEF